MPSPVMKRSVRMLPPWGGRQPLSGCRHEKASRAGYPMVDKDELSMSTDNTREGDMYADTVVGGPISRVMIDDRVIDAAGRDVGSVKFVKMGDPTAATDQG